ncbi:unnamed protein product, partial [Mesorhabditis spiculigera]
MEGNKLLHCKYSAPAFQATPLYVANKRRVPYMMTRGVETPVGPSEFYANFINDRLEPKHKF